MFLFLKCFNICFLLNSNVSRDKLKDVFSWIDSVLKKSMIHSIKTNLSNEIQIQHTDKVSFCFSDRRNPSFYFTLNSFLQQFLKNRFLINSYKNFYSYWNEVLWDRIVVPERKLKMKRNVKKKWSIRFNQPPLTLLQLKYLPWEKKKISRKFPGELHRKYSKIKGKNFDIRMKWNTDVDRNECPNNQENIDNKRDVLIQRYSLHKVHWHKGLDYKIPTYLNEFIGFSRVNRMKIYSRKSPFNSQYSPNVA